MKKTKTQKGITLVALIITIVVLLILAVVAISSIQNDGILLYANNAAVLYNQAQVNEQQTLNGFMNYLDNNTSTKKTIISFTIAGTEYQAEEGMTWAEWCDSEYNVDKYIIYNSWVCTETKKEKTRKSISDVEETGTDLILEEYAYVLSSYYSMPFLPM